MAQATRKILPWHRSPFRREADLMWRRTEVRRYRGGYIAVTDLSQDAEAEADDDALPTLPPKKGSGGSGAPAAAGPAPASPIATDEPESVATIRDPDLDPQPVPIRKVRRVG